MLSRLRPSAPRRKQSDSVLPTHHVVAASPPPSAGRSSSNPRRNKSRPTSRSGPSGHSRRPGGVIRAVPHGVPPGSVDDHVVLPGEAMCTSFLLGGAYYPGKDKRARSHLKRAHLKRTLWYRACCSSRRRAALTCVLCVLGTVYVFEPVLNWVLDLGSRLAGRGPVLRTPKAAARASLEELFPDLSGMVRPEEEYALEAAAMLEAAERQSRGGRDRVQLLAELDGAVEDFVHRNDANYRDGGDAAELAEGDNGGDDAVAGDDEEDQAANIDADSEDGEGNDDVEGNDDAEDAGDDAEEPDEDIQEIAQEVADSDEGDDGEGNAGEEGGDDDDEVAQDDGVVKGDGVVEGDGDEDRGGKPPPDEDFAEIAQQVGEELHVEGEGEGGGRKKEAGDANGDYALVDKKAKGAKKQGKAAAAVQRRTLQNADTLPATSSCPSALDPAEIGVTLVTQTTLDRAFLLERSCARWGATAGSADNGDGNSMIAVVFLPTPEDAATFRSDFRPALESKCLALTLIEYTPSEENKDEALSGRYPINKLRNIGLDAVTTSHVFVLDADFVPSSDLSATITEVLANRNEQRKSSKEGIGGGGTGTDENEALIVPVFDRHPPSDSSPCKTPEECSQYLKKDPDFLPATFSALQDCAETGNSKSTHCIPFQSDVNWEGHFDTRSEAWLGGKWYDDQYEGGGGAKKDGAAAKNEPDTGTNKIDPARAIREVRCFNSARYEPWTVLRWCPSAKQGAGDPSAEDLHPRPTTAPYYDERFSGYGKNKIQLVSHLRFLGYEFRVLPRAFAVHHPHPESRHKEVWNDAEGEELHATMDALYPQFLGELGEKYDGGKGAVPGCKEWRQRQKKRKEE